ncbi:hypothetical protein GPECTOR_29g134 [Gonium pectorale]|uniref:Ammonium transporter AmtB-like domain-containing protein n=1 Tax=Gonium pectorale TaxID=33097 RepID=A0A150GFX2_GONPE|nr:hypothetical protein GPECTOR_29g134 [Gonium pectorale]|eukprot:KXZ48230.1 hypothetical protein GPECTOR_29g134 [Gonium pectorale]
MLPPKVPPSSTTPSTVDKSLTRRHSYDWSHVGLPARESQLRKGFVGSVVVVLAIVLGLFFGLVRYTEFGEDAIEDVERHYKYFCDVQIMVFIGFGFLMTFMRRYSYGAVSFNYFASALMFLLAILCIGATQQVFWNHHRTRIQIDLALLIDCSFCAASGMIAFGAIIGKSTPTQTLWLLFWQVPLYALNQQLVIHTFKALDMGGTIVIHLFGAYYGLAASYMLSRKQPLHGLDNPKNTGAYLNDVFSMIGTIFLFLYWPSFNGALASVSRADMEHATDAEKMAQFLSIVNTLISLLGAVLSVFATSALAGGRINMVHIQNSTLAGGVAMGAACTLRMTPGGALAVGAFAGFMSTLGFQYLTPFLDRTIGLGDTCGIHNLHAMPAVLGSLVAGLAALGQHSEYLEHPNGRTQLGYQVLASVVTVGIALAGGFVGGWMSTFLNLGKNEQLTVPELFDDGAWWHGTRVEALPISASIHLANMSNSAHAAHQQAQREREGTTHRGNKSVTGGLNPIREGREQAPAPTTTITVSGVPASGHVSVLMAGGPAPAAAASGQPGPDGLMVAAPHPAMGMATMMMAPGGGGMSPTAAAAAAAADVPLFGPGVCLETVVQPVQPVHINHRS